MHCTTKKAGTAFYKGDWEQASPKAKEQNRSERSLQAITAYAMHRMRIQHADGEANKACNPCKSCHEARHTLTSGPTAILANAAEA